MSRWITEQELRNAEDQNMGELERGESFTFIVTRNGAPVDELRPLHRRRFVPAEVALAAFSGLVRIDARRFRADVDRLMDEERGDDKSFR